MRRQAIIRDRTGELFITPNPGLLTNSKIFFFYYRKRSNTVTVSKFPSMLKENHTCYNIYSFGSSFIPPPKKRHVENMNYTKMI